MYKSNNIGTEQTVRMHSLIQGVRTSFSDLNLPQKEVKKNERLHMLEDGHKFYRSQGQTELYSSWSWKLFANQNESVVVGHSEYLPMFSILVQPYVWSN